MENLILGIRKQNQRLYLEDTYPTLEGDIRVRYTFDRKNAKEFKSYSSANNFKLRIQKRTNDNLEVIVLKNRFDWI